MVKQTRRVVEDYVVYKICTVYPNGHIISQKNPSNLNRAIRLMGDQYEKLYREAYPELFNTIRTTVVVDNEVSGDLSKLAQQLFDLPLKPNSDINWGRVMALLVFGSMIAVRAVECDSLKSVDTIISWITNFYDTELSSWLISKGGWEDFYHWSKATVGPAVASSRETCSSSYNSGVQTAVRVGVLAACVGLGAFMISKK